MREILLASLVIVLGSALVVIGSVALIDPIKYAKLHARVSGRIGVPFWARHWYDPRVLTQSRDLRNQWRLMGVGFIIGGIIFVNAAGRSLIALFR